MVDVREVITITVTDLAALSGWERSHVLAAVGYVWDVRARKPQLAPIGKLTDRLEPDSTPDSASAAIASPPVAGRSGAVLSTIEPGAIPEPVEAPRENLAAPDGAPGDCPEGTHNMPSDPPISAPEYAADYSADIPAGSDPSTSPDVPQSEPIAASTMTEAEQAAWEAAMRAGVRVTDYVPPPAPVDDTPPPAPKQSGRYERTLIECEDCGKGFGRGAGMAAHKRAVHSPDPHRAEPVGKDNVVLASRPPQPLPGERWEHTCERCQRTFPGERTLEAHERTCTGVAS